MKQIVCPRCFEPITQTVYVCRQPDCKLDGVPQQEQSLARDSAGSPMCGSCGARLNSRLCDTCDFPLDSAGDNLQLPLSILGCQGCGKSNFLSVLIDRIKRDMCKAYGCALHPLGGDVTMEVYDREYHYPLFVQGRCPASTHQEDVYPLQYSLVFSGPGGAGKSCAVTLYDACGANFERQKTMTAFNRSIYHSKGIFLLVDPTQLPGVAGAYAAQGRPVLEADPLPLLARTIHLIRDGLGLQNLQQKIPIPVAVCLTKLDSIQELLDPSSFVAASSRHLRRPHLDRMDWDCCNLEVRSLMEHWGGGEILSQIDAQFAKSSFFAFSALGGQPGEMGRIHRVLPHRALDPFLWLLWQNDIIGCK